MNVSSAHFIDYNISGRNCITEENLYGLVKLRHRQHYHTNARTGIMVTISHSSKMVHNLLDNFISLPVVLKTESLAYKKAMWIVYDFIILVWRYLDIVFLNNWIGSSKSSSSSSMSKIALSSSQKSLDSFFAICGNISRFRVSRKSFSCTFLVIKYILIFLFVCCFLFFIYLVWIKFFTN